jgi:site-specific recombinase XerD
MNGIRPTENATKEDSDAMKAQLDRRRPDDVRTLVVLICLAYGLRRGEVCGLNVADFRTHEGHPVLHVETLKQRDRRVKRLVPIAAEDAAILQKYVRQEHGTTPAATDPLILTAGARFPFRVGRLTARTIEYQLRRLRTAAGITKRLTAHSFRHGFATQLIQSGADLRTVQDLMGHASIASTQVYLHSTFGRGVEAIRRMGSGA